MMSRKEYILSWIIERNGLDMDVIESNMESSYFELGWMDSFDFINFISDIEDEFNLEFDNSQFQDRRFSTLKGLIETIEGM